MSALDTEKEIFSHRYDSNHPGQVITLLHHTLSPSESFCNQFSNPFSKPPTKYVVTKKDRKSNVTNRAIIGSRG